MRSFKHELLANLASFIVIGAALIALQIPDFSDIRLDMLPTKSGGSL